MPHNVGSMAYYGERPWHRLGTAIPERANAREMIQAAGLDWTVQKIPIPNHRATQDDEPNRFHLVRQARDNSEVELPLGMVGRQYQTLQNSEAFDFFDPIIGEKKAVFETAGS